MKDSVASTRYYQVERAQFPSVTSVTGILDKGEGLLIWACKLGYEASRKEFKDKGDLGRNVHAAIAKTLAGLPDEPDPASPIYPRWVAAGGFIKKYPLALSQKGESAGIPLSFDVEQKLVSYRYGYAGTPDFVARLADGKRYIIDWKTGAYHRDHNLQLSAYLEMYNEHHPKDQAEGRILVTLRDDGMFEEKFLPYTSQAGDFAGFLGLLQAFRWLRANDFVKEAKELTQEPVQVSIGDGEGK